MHNAVLFFDTLTMKANLYQTIQTFSGFAQAAFNESASHPAQFGVAIKLPAISSRQVDKAAYLLLTCQLIQCCPINRDMHLRAQLGWREKPSNPRKVVVQMDQHGVDELRALRLPQPLQLRVPDS